MAEMGLGPWARKANGLTLDVSRRRFSDKYERSSSDGYTFGFRYRLQHMLRERNTFVLKARSGPDERPHALTLNVYLRAQDLGHFNGRGGSKAVERLLAVLDGDEAFQALVREMDDLRQLEQLVRAKAKEGGHTLELPDMTVQWQVVDEPGLPSVLQRAEGGEASTAGRYRPLPVRRLVVAVWLYPPHVEIPPTGQRIPAGDDRDFFVGADKVGEDDAVEDE